MGNCCNPFGLKRNRISLRGKKKIVLLLVGLDNAGKTSAAKSLVGESLETVVPTVGFSVISLSHRGYSVTIYDLGGGPQIRGIWHRYFGDVHGLIFVVDASDVGRLDEGRDVLEDILSNEKLAGKPVLLLANKQDCEGALDELDIVDKLNLELLVNRQRCPTMVETCSTTAPGVNKKVDPAIHNGYTWLLNNIIQDYACLNGRVETDMAAQRQLDAIAKRQRGERVKKLREERGDAGDVKSSDDEFIDGNPFQPIAELTSTKNMKIVPLDPKFDTRIILVQESPSRAKVLEPGDTKSSGTANTGAILVRESSRSKDSDDDGVFSEDDTVTLFRREGRGSRDVDNKVRSASDVEKTNDVNVSITNYVKDQLELETNTKTRRKKRAPLRRSNKTGPMPSGAVTPNATPHPLPDFDPPTHLDRAAVQDALARSRPLTPLVRTQLPGSPLKQLLLPPLRTEAQPVIKPRTLGASSGHRRQGSAWGLDKSLEPVNPAFLAKHPGTATFNHLPGAPDTSLPDRVRATTPGSRPESRTLNNISGPTRTSHPDSARVVRPGSGESTTQVSRPGSADGNYLHRGTTLSRPGTGNINSISRTSPDNRPGSGEVVRPVSAKINRLQQATLVSRPNSSDFIRPISSGIDQRPIALQVTCLPGATDHESDSDDVVVVTT